MMDRKIATLLTVAALILGGAPAWAAFENVMVSPRARAMGEAGVAVPDAVYGGYLNPAGLAEVPAGGSFGGSYVQPFGLSFNQLLFLGAAQRLPGRAGVLAFGLRQFKVEFEDVDLLKESTFTISHGLYLYEDLHSSVAIGYGVNLYRLEFGETISGLDPGSATTAGVDLALLAVLHERTRIGVLVHNLNVPKIGKDEEEIPQRLHLGASYEPYAGVITTFEAQVRQGEPTQWRGGLELEVTGGFHLRAGIMTEPSKLGAGFGYAFRGLSLDYGFATGGGVLDSSHQFGLRATWGGEAK
jgi:hypothetical protein